MCTFLTYKIKLDIYDHCSEKHIYIQNDYYKYNSIFGKQN